MFESQRCHCCASEMDQLAPYDQFTHLHCGNCGSDYFQSSSSDISAALYETDDDYLDDLAVGSRPSDFVMWHHRKALDFLRKNCRTGSTVLDVGCFNGFFVKELQSHGFEAQGIDFNRLAIEKGKREFGLGEAISCRTLQELHEAAAQFDVISAFEVLEHLKEPRTFLTDALRLLRPGGYIIISTPNNNMVSRPLLDWPPHHLSRFTVKSLTALMRANGVEPIFSAEQMSSFDLIRHRIGMLFRKSDKISLRGGSFQNKALTNRLRQIANRISRFMSIALTPVNAFFYVAGIRYISQITIGRMAD